MAHAAKIDGGVVRQVIVVDNDKLPNDGEFTPEVEAALNEYLHACGLDGDWKLTSYNNKFRGRYACKGFTYDTDLDEFTEPNIEVTDEMLAVAEKKRKAEAKKLEKKLALELKSEELSGQTNKTDIEENK